MRVMCRLRGSERYCLDGHGICCAACLGSGCEKACLNSPERCGYAERVPDPPTGYVPPTAKVLKGVVKRADSTETK